MKKVDYEELAAIGRLEIFLYTLCTFLTRNQEGIGSEVRKTRIGSSKIPSFWLKSAKSNRIKLPPPHYLSFFPTE